MYSKYRDATQTRGGEIEVTSQLYTHKSMHSVPALPAGVLRGVCMCVDACVRAVAVVVMMGVHSCARVQRADAGAPRRGRRGGLPRGRRGGGGTPGFRVPVLV